MDLKKSSTKKTVLAGGVFDIIHPGHIHTLNAAKALGDVLVVAIATDKNSNEALKPYLEIIYTSKRKLGCRKMYSY